MDFPKLSLKQVAMIVLGFGVFFSLAASAFRAEFVADAPIGYGVLAAGFGLVAIFCCHAVIYFFVKFFSQVGAAKLKQSNAGPIVRPNTENTGEQ